MNCVIANICILVLGVNFPGFLNTSLQHVPDASFFVASFLFYLFIYSENQSATRS
jgi:hypothetical protein